MTTSKKRKPEPHFEIHLRGVFPEDISIRLVADAVAALQNIVQAESQTTDIAVNVVDIHRGSAVYRCVSSHPEETIHRLRLVGQILDQPSSSNDVLGLAFPFLRNLSDVAQQTHSEVVVRRSVDGRREVLATIRPDTYDRLRSAHAVTGQTVLFGELKRVGGATIPRCMIRGYKQRHAIYCAITRAQAKHLARRLYRPVVLEGEAVWLRGSWDIIDFTVARIVPYRKRPFSEARELLRQAGADGWDRIADSQVFFSSEDPEIAQ